MTLLLPVTMSLWVLILRLRLILLLIYCGRDILCVCRPTRLASPVKWHPKAFYLIVVFLVVTVSRWSELLCVGYVRRARVESSQVESFLRILHDVVLSSIVKEVSACLRRQTLAVNRVCVDVGYRWYWYWYWWNEQAWTEEVSTVT